LAPETAVEMRLPVAGATAGTPSTEIRCKGTVVRWEQIISPETPVALGVAIEDYRIVAQESFNGSPAGHA